MILEIVMHSMGWTDVWYAHPGNFPLKVWMFWPGRWHVGVWTGPQNDLLCVKHCKTNAEAERYLSPSGPTALIACLAALRKGVRLGVRPPKPEIKLDPESL